MTPARPLSVLVVDDEPLARRRLERMVRQADGFDLAGQARDVETTLVAVQELRPDLLLLDIQMPGGGGFAVLDQLGPAAPPVIFVTAHSDFAVRAFDVSAVDYVTKPVQPERLTLALMRAGQAIAASQRASVQLDPSDNDTAPADLTDVLWVATRDGRKSITIATISHVSADRDYARLWSGDAAYLYDRSISDCEKQLTPHGFLRVHRGFLVQRRRITAMQRRETGGYALMLDGGARVPVGRSFQRRTAKALGLIGGE
jgi:DNA-binding LytR/AlgR family response regulator